MSPELVAALGGALAGGSIALLGSIAQVLTQGWMSERGEITCDVAAWRFWSSSFQENQETTNSEERGSFFGSWAETKAFYAKPISTDYEPFDIHYSFAANFLNTKGTNAAVLEYSVEFLKDERTLISLMPELFDSTFGGAVLLPAENVTTLSVKVDLRETYATYPELLEGTVENYVDALKLILTEANKAQFTARLSTGKTMRVELERIL